MTKNCITAFLFTLLASPFLFAAMVDDFQRDDPGIPSSPACTLSIISSEVNGSIRKVLAIDWPSPHRLWVECNYTKPLPVSDLAPNRNVALRMQAWIPAAPSATQFSVRLIDARNVIYQWSAVIPPAKEAGWRSLVIPVMVDQPNAKWGGQPGFPPAYPFKLAGYSVLFANDKIPAGRVLVDQITSDVLPGLGLETNRFPSLVNTTADAKCDFVISNVLEHSINVIVKGTLSDFTAASSEVAGSVDIAAQSQGRIALNLGDRHPGIRWFNGTVNLDGIEVGYKTAFVIADPIERAGRDDFLFSICSHTESKPLDEQEQEMQAAAAAGATVMRVAVAWAKLEPKPGEWRWETQDRLVELAAKYGIETQALLGFNPSHAVSESLRNEMAEAYKNHKPDAWKIVLFGPPEEAPWRRYVAQMAQRYQGKIRFYEIWNEPDLGFWRGTTEQYIQTLRAGSEEIRRVDPQAKILSGGFATVLQHAGRANNPDLQERVLAEASDAFDIHAIHQHGPINEFVQAFEGELRRIRARMSQQKPLYFNETAISSTFGGEKFQATTLVKKITYAMAHGAIGYTWYDLRNDGPNSGDAEQNYGLLTERFIPKASFAAYGELVRRLHSTRFIGSLDLGPDRHAYVFGSARGRVLVWWNEGPNVSEIPVLLRCGNGAVKQSDIMGVSQELPQFDGIILAQPTAKPQYIEMPAGAGMPEFLGTLVRFDGPADATIDQPMNVTAVMTNPLSKEMQINLSWRDVAGKEMTKLFSVPAKGQTQLPLTIKAPSQHSIVQAMDLRFAVEGKPWSGTLRHAVPVLRKIGSTGPEQRNADWVLDTPGDIVNFTLADPSLSGMQWKGPNDLSAKIWMWLKDHQLHIRVDVRDDVHFQNEKPVMSWRGDGVQLAFQIPGEKDLWEIGAAQANDGSILRTAWTTPTGISGAENFFTATIEPINAEGLRYEFTLPCDRFGLSDKALSRGLRFNMVVNDNDGTMRKQAARIAQGMIENKDPNLFPIIHFAPASLP